MADGLAAVENFRDRFLESQEDAQRPPLPAALVCEETDARLHQPLPMSAPNAIRCVELRAQTGSVTKPKLLSGVLVDISDAHHASREWVDRACWATAGSCAGGRVSWDESPPRPRSPWRGRW